MNTRQYNLVIGGLTLFIALLLFVLVTFNRDDFLFSESDYEEEIETRDATGYEDGVSLVRLARKDQDASGIEVIELAVMRHQAEYQLFGEILDITGLLELRERLITLSNEDRAKDVEEAHLADAYKRASLLFEDRQNISRRELMESEYQLNAVRTYRLNLRRNLASLKHSANATWGAEVSDWLLDEYSQNFKNLVTQQSSLIRLFVRNVSLSAKGISTVDIAPVGFPTRKVSARYVSEAPSAQLGTGAADKFFMTDTQMPTGTRVIVSLSENLEGVSGVFIPDEAVLWHSGKPWVFKRHSEGVFARFEIEADVDLGLGWFEVNAFVPGDQIVVSGAQLLLSEELKYQIRNENED